VQSSQITQKLFLFILKRKHKLTAICSLLGYYAAQSGNSLPTFRDNLSGPIFKD